MLVVLRTSLCIENTHYRMKIGHSIGTVVAWAQHKIRRSVKHSEVAENVEKHRMHHTKCPAKDVRDLIITISATRYVFLRHCSHV